MRFWLDKGVDGFRMDVIPFISKDPKFPNLTPAQLKRPEYTYTHGPHMHEYLHEMNQQVLSKYDIMTVGEAFGATLAETPLLVDERRGELNMVFNFDAVRLNRNGTQWRDWTLPDLKAIYTRQYKALDAHSWNAIFLSNHDNPRVVSAFGDNSPESAKVLATLVLTLKGTAFIYQGDELGMTNYPFQAIDDFNDIEARNGYVAQVENGNVKAPAYLANLLKMSRDNSRTPMQWDNSHNAGFSTAKKTWLPVNPNYTQINAEAEAQDPNSVFHYFQWLIAFRKRTPALVYGDYKDLDPQHPTVFAYTRDKYLVILNFSKKSIRYELPPGAKAGHLILSNQVGPREEQTSTLNLKPWEARIYQ
jgi:oligo-1,6-glucosidase